MEVYGPTHQPLLRLTRVRKTTGHDLVTHVEKESMTSTSQMVGRAPLGGHSEVPGDGGGVGQERLGIRHAGQKCAAAVVLGR